VQIIEMMKTDRFCQNKKGAAARATAPFTH